MTTLFSFPLTPLIVNGLLLSPCGPDAALDANMSGQLEMAYKFYIRTNREKCLDKSYMCLQCMAASFSFKSPLELEVPFQLSFGLI